MYRLPLGHADPGCRGHCRERDEGWQFHWPLWDWQKGKEAGEIRTELNTIHRTILGVEASTCISAGRNELRVKAQLLRANIASLKFRNHIFSTPESRLTHRVYKALLGDPKKGTMHIKNGAKWHMETSASTIGWTEGGKGVRSSSTE